MRGAKAPLSFCAAIVNKSTLICKQFVNLGGPESNVEARIPLYPPFVNKSIKFCKQFMKKIFSQNRTSLQNVH